MAYLHIPNLYKEQDILLLKECFALEKIHGSSAHVAFNPDGLITFFAGGTKHEDFVKLFDENKLKENYTVLNVPAKIVVFGEAYGGKMQGMSTTYGNQLRFVAFEVKIDENWLDVPNAEDVAVNLGFDFVFYKKIPTTIEALNAERDADSVQAIKNGMGAGHMREGIVLRPMIEMTRNNGNRIIAKYKRDDFSETKTKRSLTQDDINVLIEAEAIANEWVTPMRLQHVLDKMPADISIEQTREVINAMIEDIRREAEGEIELSKKATIAIGKATAQMYKKYLNERIGK